MDRDASWCCTGVVQFEVDTKASPEQVRQALTDFSPRRLQIWNQTLDPRKYELRALGDTWAVAREASRGSPFWVVVRYDWSDPTAIRWIVEESSYGGGGTGVASIAPRDGGGSRVSVAYDATGARPAQWPMLYLLHRKPMGRVIARWWRAAFDGYADAEADRAAG